MLGPQLYLDKVPTGSILFYPITLQGCWGTTDDFATIPFHLILFSVALVQLAKSIPVHSLTLSVCVLVCFFAVNSYGHVGTVS